MYSSPNAFWESLLCGMLKVSAVHFADQKASPGQHQKNKVYVTLRMS
jgi:hypothetical protein